MSLIYLSSLNTLKETEVVRLPISKDGSHEIYLFYT